MAALAVLPLTVWAGREAMRGKACGCCWVRPHSVPRSVRHAKSKGQPQRTFTRYRQIKISVIVRQFGRTILIPIWFVLEDEKLYLLPVQGPDTQWYRNVLQNPKIGIETRGVGTEFQSAPVTDAKSVKSVVEKFQEKYGAKDVKKYYSKFDAAVLVELV